MPRSDESASATQVQRVLFDTNVLLDVLLKRPGLAAESARLWDAADTGAVYGLVPSISVPTISYLVGRAYDAAQAWSDVRTVLATFDVAAVGRAELAGALASGFDDFEDGVVHEAALSSRCDAVVTRNGRDVGRATVPVVTPAEMLAALAA